MKDHELDEWLSSLRDEPWPEERLVRWRVRVRSRVARTGCGWWCWVPAPALALACAIWMLAAIQTAPRLEISNPPPGVVAEVWRQPRPRPAAAPPVVKSAPARQRVRRVENREFIRIVTDDPDVVILLAMNGKGDEK